MRSAEIRFKDLSAGILKEEPDGYSFAYFEEYLSIENSQPISLSFPLKSEPYREKYLFPFFDGLIPEGWLLDVAVENWKLNPRDRMGLLLACCRDCIGAVSVIERKEFENE